MLLLPSRYSQTSEECQNLAKNTADAGQENVILPSHRLGALSLAKKTLLQLLC